MQLILIAAIAENGAIGYSNNLIYSMPADMQHFKALTTGNTVIMGRRTYESLPKGALPNRRNIVLTSHGDDADYPRCEVFRDLPSALASCAIDEKVYVMGGASVYAAAMPLATHMSLTLIHDTPALADTFFPMIGKEWEEVSRDDFKADDRHAADYSFVEYNRAN